MKKLLYPFIVLIVSSCTDSNPPEVSIATPRSGDVVSDSVVIVAVASDDEGVVSVDFLLDSTEIASVTSEPWETMWATKNHANGIYQLSAVASDEAGNEGRSDDVEIEISNFAVGGTWGLAKEIAVYDSSYIENEYVHINQIVIINEEQMIIYENDACTSDYDSETLYISEFNDTVLMVDGEPIEYRIEDNYLIFKFDDGDGFYDYVELYWLAYTGDFPPERWSSVENDSFEPNNTNEEATSIVVNADPQDHIMACEESDWFQFDATSGITYDLEVTSDFDSYLELYDSDGDLIDYSDDYSESDLDARLFYTATSTGSYYFEVHGFGYYSSEYGPYSISVTTSSQRIASSIEVRSPRSDHLLKQEIKTRKANLKRWFQQ